jgi:hypothetical protein
MLIRLDSGGDTSIGSNSEKHNKPRDLCLNVSGDRLLSTLLNVSILKYKL